MKLSLRLFLVLALALVGSQAFAQTGGSKSDKDAKEEKAETKVRGQLPSNYSKLGLSDEQKQKIYKMHAEMDAKIDKLESEVKKLKEERRKEAEKVLTDGQKARLKELMNKGGDSKSGEKSDKGGS